jgi:hypothetical protein
MTQTIKIANEKEKNKINSPPKQSENSPQQKEAGGFNFYKVRHTSTYMVGCYPCGLIAQMAKCIKILTTSVVDDVDNATTRFQCSNRTTFTSNLTLAFSFLAFTWLWATRFERTQPQRLKQVVFWLSGLQESIIKIYKNKFKIEKKRFFRM